MALQNSVMILLSQLAMSLPMLLVYVVGMGFALRYWRRASRPAMLAMLGLALMLMATVGVSASQAYYIGTAGPGGIGAVAMRMQIVGVALMLVRAAGLGLVIAGVFSGRPRESMGGFEVGRSAGAPPLAQLAPPPQA